MLVWLPLHAEQRSCLRKCRNITFIICLAYAPVKFTVFKAFCTKVFTAERVIVIGSIYIYFRIFKFRIISNPQVIGNSFRFSLPGKVYALSFFIRINNTVGRRKIQSRSNHFSLLFNYKTLNFRRICKSNLIYGKERSNLPVISSFSQRRNNT